MEGNSRGNWPASWKSPEANQFELVCRLLTGILIFILYYFRLHSYNLWRYFNLIIIYLILFEKSVSWDIQTCFPYISHYWFFHFIIINFFSCWHCVTVKELSNQLRNCNLLAIQFNSTSIQLQLNWIELNVQQVI